MYRRAYVSRDKTPGLLYLLPIPDKPWRDLSIDFKSFLLDKKGFDTVLVIVDRLTKQAISIPCFKTTTAEDLARLFT